MLIAVARARLVAGTEWAAWLRRIEWPFLLEYERGAGASVKRACHAWGKNDAAWGKRADDQEKYFAAGANGAAMRIAPHAIVHHQGSFSELAVDVVRDAATTHGHPRALLGALVHAYALWISMRQPAPLPYGWLIKTTLEGLVDWREPVWREFDGNWLDAAAKAYPEGYEQVWDATVREVEDLLTKAQISLDSGALSSPSGFLEAHGLTRRATNGSGTLCAVGAIYLAARSASSPDRGISVPARLDGADTDTLASMTGSLLGAGLGREWLGSMGRNVQDEALLIDLAERLLRPSSAAPRIPSRAEAAAARERFRKELDTGDDSAPVLLPDGRSSRIESRAGLAGGGWTARRTRLLTGDGQSLYVMDQVQQSVVGLDEPVLPRTDGSRVTSSTETITSSFLESVDLPVVNLERVRQALETLGIAPARAGDDWFSYEKLRIRQTSAREANLDVPAARVRLVLADLATARAQLHEMGFDGGPRADGGFWASVDPFLVVVVTGAGFSGP
ncbi:hypothetical protein HNR73_004045 [Phytomonospora endophytica]|uniref:ADP-ribosylglycohydrolase n=2 Tax=Phytomonospora endophytica TaxID=714109 RepID=A0A841FS91_9ACTN|nr:hypothetical protein [Phytomonospora endophytica]GIG67082.1 hypothetical protein Pen01_33770 [Phytomonospora endophytica]